MPCPVPRAHVCVPSPCPVRAVPVVPSPVSGMPCPALSVSPWSMAVAHLVALSSGMHAVPVACHWQCLRSSDSDTETKLWKSDGMVGEYGGRLTPLDISFLSFCFLVNKKSPDCSGLDSWIFVLRSWGTFHPPRNLSL